MRLNYLNHNLYEVEAVTPEVEHKQPIIVNFLILQSAQLPVLELYYIFLDKFCDFNSLEEMEMDTNYLYLALPQHSLEDCIKPKMSEAWIKVSKQDCSNTFSADSFSNFYLERVALNKSIATSENLDFPRKSFVALE